MVGKVTGLNSPRLGQVPYGCAGYSNANQEMQESRRKKWDYEIPPSLNSLMIILTSNFMKPISLYPSDNCAIPVSEVGVDALARRSCSSPSRA